MSLFDNLQTAAFGTVTNVMGYTAYWLPANTADFNPADFSPGDFDTFSSSTIAGRVLYNGPTEKEKLLSVNYDPEKITMEYKHGDFTGLYEAARGSSFEPVYIIGIGYFHIRSIAKKFDGKTYEARLAKLE